jgi:DNA-binding transcriptional MocR family regulator
VDYARYFSAESRSMRPNPIRALSSVINRPGVISFAGGVPSPETFPADDIAEIAAALIRERSAATLQYQPTRGNRDLLEYVAAFMQERGATRVSLENLVVTTGAQQALDVIARNLLDPGDVAAVAIPSYIGGIAALQNAQARLVGVREESDGIDMAAFEETLRRQQNVGAPVKLAYVISNFQNPSGVTLSDVKRDIILDLAARYDFLIIEDDPYGELYFDAPPPPSIFSRDRTGRVVYVGSFSKTLAPGLRVGWLAAPAPLAARFELCMETAVLCPGVLDQAIVAECCRRGLAADRLPRLREFYGVRRRAMLDALAESADPQLRWTQPDGGLFVWVDGPPAIDAEAELTRLVESGVAYIPGRPFCIDDSGKNAFRLAFSKESPDRIREGVQTLLHELSRSV